MTAVATQSYGAQSVASVKVGSPIFISILFSKVVVGSPGSSSRDVAEGLELGRFTQWDQEVGAPRNDSTGKFPLRVDGCLILAMD